MGKGRQERRPWRKTDCFFRAAVFVHIQPILYIDTPQKTLLNAVEHRIVLDDSKVLGLGEELLVGIDTGAKHLGSLSRSHLVHLLRHLACGYFCC